MKIIIPRFETVEIHRTYDGGNKYIDYLGEKLSKKKVNVKIVTTSIKGKNIEEKRIKNVKYKLIKPVLKKERRFKLNLLYKFIFSYNLNKYLKKEDFDLLHNTEMFAYFYLRNKKRKPVITQGFGLEPFYGPESLSQKGLKKLYVKILKYFWRYCIDRSDKIASLEDFQIPLIRKLGVKREKIFNLPIGIDIKKINRFRKRHKNRRKELGIKKNDLVLIGVSQIAPDKQINDIIEAFYLIKKEIKNPKLIIIGSGSLEKNMREAVKKFKLERDFFHLRNIPEKELYDYYFSSDIFISASLQKDWISSIVEAMACDLPIVSSNQPFLVKNGVNGFVVGPKNPERIKEGILKIYKRGKKNMKRMGRNSRKMGEKYDYNNITKLAIREYKKLLKKRI